MQDNSASKFVKKKAASQSPATPAASSSPRNSSGPDFSQEKKSFSEKSSQTKSTTEPASEAGMRLQVFLAHSGIASRRACEALIAEGRVSVNGTVVTTPGTKVLPTDKVLFDGQPVVVESKKRYVLLNKPAGYVCSLADEKGRSTAAELLAPHFSERLYNVGRLDMFSQGLVLFTNDGDFAARVSHPSSQIEKEYVVEATVPIPQELVDRFCRGIRIEGVFYRCLEARLVHQRRLIVVLIEGKNREIRRVFEHFEVPIRRLTRVRIGNLNMDSLEEGKYRELDAAQVAGLLALCQEN